MWRNYSRKVQPPARPAFQGGLFIGRWIDTDGEGRYDTLEIETRGFKGPRATTTAAFRCIATTSSRP